MLANCWSHARRKFIEAEASAPEDAVDILDKIGAMFGIESEADVMSSDLGYPTLPRDGSESSRSRAAGGGLVVSGAQRSEAPWHRMQKGVSGRTFNRRKPTGSPQAQHRPNSPSSTRRKACRPWSSRS